MSPPIRVLELRSVRGTGGGPEKTILHGAACAAAHRCAITVCYLRDDRDDVFAIDARAARLPIEYMEIRERHSFDPSIWRALVHAVRTRRIDIVHAHDYKTDLLALLLARATGAIPLSTAHNWAGCTWRERRVYYPVDRYLLRWFPRVIAVSSKVRATLIAAGVRRERIATLLNSIDPEQFRRDARAADAARRELDLGPAEIAIGAVGRLEAVKRFDVLLEAFATLRQTHGHVKLFIVGDGSLRATLAAQAARLGLNRAFRLLGHRSDVVRLHGAFDLFVQSSDDEGTPNSVLEAMALETPIVATDAGGTRDLIRDGTDGLLVRCGDPEALARAMERAIIDRAATRARVASARARIERDLSFEQRTRSLEAIYEDLIARSGRDRFRAATMAPGNMTAPLRGGPQKDPL